VTRGGKAGLDKAPCGVARALDAVGDWWSLLIVRDALRGVRRFCEFERSLGLAKNILSARLRKLVEMGILETAPASDGSAYHEYRLTPKGESLYVVVIALWQWGEANRFDETDRCPLDMVDALNGRSLVPLEVRADDGRILGPGDYRVIARE